MNWMETLTSMNDQETKMTLITRNFTSAKVGKGRSPQKVFKRQDTKCQRMSEQTNMGQM